MRRPFLALLLIAVAPAIYAQSGSERFAEYGQLIIVQLPSAPFPHPRRATGHTYGGRSYSVDAHYSDSSVAIFIPRGFRQAEATDFIVHFHGWWNNIDTTLGRYQLPQQLVESGKNAILVVPEGPRNAPDSFGGKLEDAGAFKKLIEDVIDVLVRQSKIKTRTIGTIILSGHSGSYRVISFVLMRGGIPEKIREVYLFDALYGQAEKYVYWLDHYQGKMINVFTDSGGTKEETELLMADLEGWGIPYLLKDEVGITPEDLHKHRLIFIHTDLDHEAVMHGRSQFLRYLSASCLRNR